FINVVLRFIDAGIYYPQTPVATISHSMDVGNPNNFVRMSRLLGDDIDTIREKVVRYFFDDDEARSAMREVYSDYGYIVCPHTAVAYLGLKKYRGENNEDVNGVL